MVVLGADYELRSAVKQLLEAGYQLSPAALELLRGQKDPCNLVERLLAEGIQPNLRVLRPEHFAPVLKQEKSASEEAEKPILPTIGKREVPARDVKTDIKVLKDPTGHVGCKGTVEDFLAHFRDRYRRLREIIGQRGDSGGIIDIKEASRYKRQEQGKRKATVKIVGMVTNKYLSRSGNLALELEDPTGRITAVISQKNRTLTEKAHHILLDQVICVEGMPVGAGMLLAQDLFWPDIPIAVRERKVEDDICAVLISDIHFGSRHFLEPVFRRFLRWLQGKEGNDEQVELAGKVKYLVIAGDLVDGIGVYPDQRKDILITNLEKQYEKLAQLLEGIPDHIDVIISPGNHDGVRNAIPRPAINPRYIEPLEKAVNSMTSLGCPCQFELHGVNLLVFHGDSITDIMGEIRRPELEASFAAMQEMLRGRHLAPIYGKDTSIAPEPRDWLVIEQIPDVLHCGHVHVNSIGPYRGTLIVNSGTFQSQTEYQQSIGITPTPGIVPVLNLRTRTVSPLNFLG